MAIPVVSHTLIKNDKWQWIDLDDRPLDNDLKISTTFELNSTGQGSISRNSNTFWHLIPRKEFVKPALTINRLGDLRNVVAIDRMPFIGCQFDLRLGFQMVVFSLMSCPYRFSLIWNPRKRHQSFLNRWFIQFFESILSFDKILFYRTKIQAIMLCFFGFIFLLPFLFVGSKLRKLEQRWFFLLRKDPRTTVMVHWPLTNNKISNNICVKEFIFSILEKKLYLSAYRNF